MKRKIPVPAGKYLEGAGLALMAGQKYEAAEFFLKGGEFETAAILFAKIGRYDRAAVAHEKAENTVEAAAAWSRAGEHSKAAGIYAKAGRSGEAAEAFGRAGEFTRAAELYAEAERFLDAAKMASEANAKKAMIGYLQKVPSDHPDSTNWATVSRCRAPTTSAPATDSPPRSPETPWEGGLAITASTWVIPLWSAPKHVTGFDGPDVIGVGPGNEAPRNAIMGDALHRVDVRVTKVFDFGVVRVSGIAELFNVFNHVNYGNYQGFINRSNFGNPRQNGNIAYGPRSAQFAFRIEF